MKAPKPKASVAMRILTVLVVLCLVSAIALTLSIKPLILYFAKSALCDIFPKSSVSIASCDIKPLKTLVIRDITIEKGKVYAFKIKEAGIDYTLESLFRRIVSRAYLKGLTVDVKTPRTNLLGLSTHIKLKPSNAFLIETLELSDAKLNLKTKDVVLKTAVSLQIDLTKQLINALEVSVESLDINEFSVRQAHMRVLQNDTSGEFFVKQARYGKVKIEDMHSKLETRGTKFSFNNLTARILNGEMRGRLTVAFDKDIKYMANLKFLGLDAAKFVDDFALKDNLLASGRWQGSLLLAGEGLSVRRFDGNFSSSDDGSLTITNKEFLAAMAERTNVPFDILVERFKDYHYNNGIMDLSFERMDLLPRISLEGEKGKSAFEINLHDFVNMLLTIFKLGGGAQ